MSKYMPLSELRGHMVYPEFADKYEILAKEREKRNPKKPLITVTLYLFKHVDGSYSRRFEDRGVKVFADALKPYHETSEGGFYTMSYHLALAQRWVKTW